MQADEVGLIIYIPYHAKVYSRLNATGHNTSRFDVAYHNGCEFVHGVITFGMKYGSHPSSTTHALHLIRGWPTDILNDMHMLVFIYPFVFLTYQFSIEIQKNFILYK